MNLLFVIHSLQAGGAERVTANLANHWAARGWDVAIATFEPVDTDFYRLHAAVARHAIGLVGESGRLSVGITQNVRRVRALRKLIRRVQPDLMVSMMTSSNVLLALSAGAARHAIAIGSERNHPPLLELDWPWRVMRRVVFRRLNAMVALSAKSAEWLARHAGVRNVHVIPNVASWPLPVTPPVVVPDDVVPADRKLLLSVGRLDAQKGFDRLLDAFGRVAREQPEWDLAIIGAGSLRAELDERVRALGLTGRVHLPGHCGNVGEWYDRADLYVLSSRYEGFPNTLAEAMACGVPAVAFDCDTGPRDIIRDGIDGRLVPQDDIDALASTLAIYMRDDRLRREQGERAIEARMRFSNERVIRQWEALFSELSHAYVSSDARDTTGGSTGSSPAP